MMAFSHSVRKRRRLSVSRNVINAGSSTIVEPWLALSSGGKGASAPPSPPSPDNRCCTKPVAAPDAAVVLDDLLELVQVGRVPVQPQDDLAVEVLLLLAALESDAASLTVLLDELENGVAPRGIDVFAATRQRERDLDDGQPASHSCLGRQVLHGIVIRILRHQTLLVLVVVVVGDGALATGDRACCLSVLVV